MEENNQTNKEVKTKAKKASKSVTVKLNLNFFYIASAIIVLIVVFFIGKSFGDNDDKSPLSRNNPASSLNSRSEDRWTAIGSVQEISADRIKVKDSRDEVKDAKINKDTKIVNRKGDNLKATDIKKDQRVIISGQKDSKGALTANRIRVQQ